MTDHWPLLRVARVRHGHLAILVHWQQSPRLSRIGCAVPEMVRVRSGQAHAWPLASNRSGCRGSGAKRDFVCGHPDVAICACRPAVTVTLEAGGTDTYTQRTIPSVSLAEPITRALPPGHATALPSS
jgi:hypothetical protein